MLTLFLSVIAGLFLFLLGLYLGHQLGSTEHIRKRLNRDRRHRQRNQHPSASTSPQQTH